MFKFFKTGYQKVTQALVKTKSVLSSRINALFGKPWDESTFDKLEQILYEADLGSTCVKELLDHIHAVFRLHPINDLPTLLEEFRKKSLEILYKPSAVVPLEPRLAEPKVILIVGINGSGKTTSLAKLGLHFQAEGKKVLFGAGDTFRAGAIDQLSLWADKLGIDIVKSASKGDPSALAFDTLTAAKARKMDIVLLDTAGRLQNKQDLMQELEKIKRTCHKVIPESPHEVLLVLDATSGQNALDQAKIFHKYVPLTGLILTKLDGSAKGGIVLSVYKELGVPIRFIGVGEGAQDLIPFDPEAYVQALF